MTPPSRSGADVVVVGAGLSGAAAAHELARDGADVLLLDRWAPGHQHGSSHGRTRIVRCAYPDPFWAGLAARAWRAWQELQARSGIVLVRRTGALDHGQDRDLGSLTAALQQAGVRHQFVTADEAAERWPLFRAHTPVLYHDDAGVLDPELAIRILIDLAHGYGARTDMHAGVTGVARTRDQVVVTTQAGSSIRAQRVVLALGPWLADPDDRPHDVAEYLDEVGAPALQVTQQQVLHLPVRRAGASASMVPTLVHKGPGQFFCMPAGKVDGTEAVKVGEHDHGTTTSASQRTGVVDPGARARMLEFAKHTLPGVVPEPFAETTCLYTRTPTEDFLLDSTPDGGVVLVSPCSGHGAKFAPVIGRMVADLVAGQPPPSRFRGANA